jgi:hypothetical protein
MYHSCSCSGLLARHRDGLDFPSLAAILSFGEEGKDEIHAFSSVAFLLLVQSMLLPL